jgi:hypothetical protein
MTKLMIPKPGRNRFSNKPSTSAVARAVSAHATIVTDERTDRQTDDFAIAIDDNFY